MFWIFNKVFQFLRVLIKHVLHKAKKWNKVLFTGDQKKMNKLQYIHTKEFCSSVKRNKLLIYTTWINLENIMLNEKGLHKGNAPWLHLNEVLEQDKLIYNGGKIQNKGERVDWERQAGSFWGDINVNNMMGLHYTGACLYQNSKLIQRFTRICAYENSRWWYACWNI